MEIKMEEATVRFGALVVLTMLAVSPCYAFEMDSFKSGIGMKDAEKRLGETSYSDLQITENHIIATHTTTKRFISLNFCKGKLVEVQKHLKPEFSHFVSLVAQQRAELGRPIDAWSEPPDATSSIERNSIRFRWKRGATVVEASFTEFTSNTQVDITYKVEHSCW